MQVSDIVFLCVLYFPLDNILNKGGVKQYNCLICFCFKCFVYCGRFWTDALFSEVLFETLFRKVAL